MINIRRLFSLVVMYLIVAVNIQLAFAVDNTDSVITYKFRNPNNLEELSGVFTERFYLEEVGDELLSEQITYDTIIFYTDTDMLNLTISN